MIENLAELVNGDPAIVRWGRRMNETFMVEVGDTQFLLTVRDGKIEKVEKGPFTQRSWRFAIRASARVLGEVLAEAAGAGLARPVRAAQARRREVRGRPARADGLPAVREAGARGAAERMKLEPIVGRYAHHRRKHRIYFEEAGQGIPLLCLHTAGSDGRQYRAVLNDPQITKNYRVITFDMPWHGKSSPPAGWQNEDYRLTTGSYTAMIMELRARARARAAGGDGLLDRRAHRARPRAQAREASCAR